MLILFVCCLISGTLGVGLILIDMESLGTMSIALDKTWVGFTLLLFFAVFIIELVVNMDNNNKRKE
jgi:hypothetical protein